MTHRASLPLALLLALAPHPGTSASQAASAGVASAAAAVALGPAEASADSILATARDLSGETGIGARSRFAPRPGTAVYAGYLRDRLDAALRPLGGYARLEPFDPAFDYDGPEALRNPYTNVVGFLPGALGEASPGYFLLGAHFDATSMGERLSDPSWDPFTVNAPGADDNASGVAAILEALRLAAVRGLRPEAGLRVVFFDGEEQQMVEKDRFLLGSGLLADSLRAQEEAGGDRLYALVNADMIAYNPRRDSLVVITNLTSRWLANQLLAVREEDGYAEGLQVERLVQGLTFSDHGPFWEEGFDAVMLTESAGADSHAPHYHRVTDTVDAAYSRGGRQVALTADLLAGLLAAWSRTESHDLTVTGEDILVQAGNAIDLASVDVGDEVTVLVGVTNRGGSLEAPWKVTLDVETLDGAFLSSLGSEHVAGVTPAGAHVKLRFPWTPVAGEEGVVRLKARIAAPAQIQVSADRLQAVRGGASEVQSAFVYPNPTRDPESAMLAYELTQNGSVRLAVVALDGKTLAEHDIAYDRARVAPGTAAGLARIPLADVLGGTRLAPGLYLLRVELFDDAGGSADVAVAKFVVLR